MTPACGEGWIDRARQYLEDGLVPLHDEWKELMIEALITRIDKLSPKKEPGLTQKELKEIRSIIRVFGEVGK